MKIANFTSILNWDSSWTGGNITSYDAYGNLAKTINCFINEHNLELIKVDYAELNCYRQHGTSEKNRDIYTKVIATVFYNGELNIYKCTQCNKSIVEKNNELCESCNSENYKKYMEKFRV